MNINRLLHIAQQADIEGDYVTADRVTNLLKTAQGQYSVMPANTTQQPNAQQQPNNQSFPQTQALENLLLKMKQEASGYPDWVKTEEDKNQFKQEYFNVEGIVLENVEKNPGKRAYAKTMLNCLWGKIGRAHV